MKKYVIGYLVIGAGVAAWTYNRQGLSKNLSNVAFAGLLWPVTLVYAAAWSGVKE